MRVRCVAVVLAAPLLSTPTFTLAAQPPVRILRHAPPDTARPGDVITISFDRPVVGSLDRTPDAARIVRIEPRLDARIQWRDAATLRIIPRTPLVPGSRYHIRVANDFTAIDGGRLDAPYEFTILTKGPALVASLPRLAAGSPYLLDPNGKLLLTYSAAVDSAAFSPAARLELEDGNGCTRRTIRYRWRGQRELADTDDWQLRWTGGWGADTTGHGFRRVVEIRPVSVPPEGCRGTIVLPSLDPNDRAEIRYPVATQPRFAIEQLTCNARDCGAGRHLRLWFSAPVRRDSLLSRLRVDPPVPFDIVGADAPSNIWHIGLTVMPRTTYRVRVDPSLTDVFGRRITGRLEASLTTGDREATLGHQLGFFTLARPTPLLRITHVNVDSAELVIVPIPDSLRVLMLDPSTDADSSARIVARLRDTVLHRVRFDAPFNVERSTEVAIPARVIDRFGGSLLAIRARRLGRLPGQTSRSPTTVENVERVEMIPRNQRPLARRTAIVQVTNLIAHAKVGDMGGAVLVTDARGGRPVPGARVTVRDARDNVMASGISDHLGVAALRESPSWRPGRAEIATPDAPYWWNYGHARMVEVTLGRDRSLTPIQPQLLADAFEDVYRLGGQYLVPRRARASVFTDRGIYRPGETVYISATVRRVRDGVLHVPSAGDSIRIRITHQAPGEREPQTIRDKVLRVSAFGTVADSFALARSLTLGNYAVRVEAMSHGWEPAGDHAFRLAEYRTPEFEASLALDTTRRYLGDTLRGRVGAHYYFGAPMAGAVVRWQAYVSQVSGVPVPGLPAGFTIGPGHHGSGGGRSAYKTLQGVDTLDANGVARLAIPTRADSILGPAQASVTTTIDDINRQPVSSRQSTWVHARLYIAARDSGTSGYWSEGKTRRIEVLAVRPDGQRVSGVPVRVAVVHHRFVYTEQPDGSSPVSRWVSDTVLRDSVSTANAPVYFDLTPRGSGQYEVVFTGRDDDDRRLRTTLGGYVFGPGWAPGGDNLTRLPVLVDQKELAPGDTMIVRFTSPFPRAEAWVTMEREGVVAQRRLAVRAGDATVRVPVTERFIAGGYVSVVLVNSGSVERSDSAHHRVRAGYAFISVNRKIKTLTVAVRPERPRYTPGDSARITIAVRDHHARPVHAEITLWAVDEGVLALTGYAAPNPLDRLYASGSTGLQFASTANRMASAKRYLFPPDAVLAMLDGPAYGSRAGNASLALRVQEAEAKLELAVRSQFRSTAFYLSGVTTDAAGEATVSVKLPDNVTTFRIMAVAATRDDRFGSGDSSIVVTKPLLARPSLPRFIRTGDTVLAGAVINNDTGDSVAVRVRATGKNVTASGGLTATRSLAQGRGSEVRFDWRSTALPGDSATFRFDVDGGPHADAVEVSLPVRPPYSPRYHAVAGVSRGQTSVGLRLPHDIDPAKSRLTLRIGTSPLPLVRAAYAHLSVYAYECSEQLASTGHVLLSMLRLQRAGVLDSNAAPDARALRGRLQFVVDELLRRQDRWGGIGYWTRDSWTTIWLTAYAGSFLVDARAAGATVDPRSIERITRFVVFDPDTTSWLKPETYGTRLQRERALRWILAQELAVLHFLRHAGVPDTALENRLVTAVPGMLWEDRVWLAELLAKRADQSAARAVLARAWRDVEMAGIRVDIPDSLVQTPGFRSHVRPSARLLRATRAMEPGHPRIAGLIERVVQQGRAERDWLWNTQDYAELSGVLADLAISQREARAHGTIRVRSRRGPGAGRVLLSGVGAALQDSTISLDGLLERDGDAMVLPLTVESSDDPLFYVLTVDEVPLRPPKAPDAKGMIVERWFERFDDGRPVTEVREGDLVRGRLRVTVPADREFVAVEDLLPAGLEVVDLSLRTSSLGPFESEWSRDAERAGNRANTNVTRLPWLYGTWAGGWWSPWEHREIRDDRVVYFARVLWKGSYTASYVARATTAGTFIRPPAHAEEMYNPSLGGRSDGGTFRVLPRE